MAKIHENYIINLFSNNDFVLTGSELSAKICDEFPNCTPENSRKIIQNAVKKHIITSSNPITFGKNQYVYYSNQYNLSEDDIKKILKSNNKSMYRVIERFRENGGIISYPELFKISGCVIGKSNTKVHTINDVIFKLEKMNLVKKERNYGVGYLVSNEMSDPEKLTLMNIYNESIKLDCMFIAPFLYWMKKHNLIDGNTIVYRNKNNLGQGVNHNNLFWDAYAYTSTTGYCEYLAVDDKKNEDKKTLVVIDFKISGIYDSIDLDGFYERIQIHRNSVKNKNNKRKVLPIIVSQEMSPFAESSLRKLKILSFNLGTVFGERIYEILNNLKEIALLENLNENIENILKILKESGQETNLGNLKGDLFERLMYPVIQQMSQFANIRTGFKYKDFEYDYITESNNEIIVFELKGYNSSKIIHLGKFENESGKPTKETVKWFFNYTFPQLKEYYADKKNEKPIKACYITTAQFSDDANSKLEILSKGLKPKNINLYYDGKELLEFLKYNDFKDEIKIIKKYYIETNKQE